MPLTDKRYVNVYPDYVGLGHVVTGTPNTIGYIDLDSNQFTLDKQFITLVTQGTTATHEKDVLDKMLAKTNNQVMQEALLEAMLGVAHTGVAGETGRYGYDGTLNSQNFEIKIRLKGTELNSGADQTWTVRIWKVQPKNFDPLAAFTAKQVVEQTAEFSVQQAKTDLLDAAIAGLKNALKGDYLSIIVDDMTP